MYGANPYLSIRLTAKQIQESEGVFMIVLHDSIFGYIRIIVSQLAERIAIVSKSSEAVLKVIGYGKNMLAFSYSAAPTRHAVSGKLMD